ncbi:MAG: hypothetical protein J0H75_05495, partial [Rhizobiales bacterium]|nr:hypothetical protein [Hyphomicrobiales bacterium]
MSKLKSLRRLLRERGTLAVLAVAGLMLFAIAAPASAQLFPFFGGGPQQPQRHQRGGLVAGADMPRDLREGGS